MSFARLLVSQFVDQVDPMGPGANALFFASPTCLSLEGPSRNVLTTLVRTPNLIGRYSDSRAPPAPRKNSEASQGRDQTHTVSQCFA
jgi:hypothetical protein